MKVESRSAEVLVWLPDVVGILLGAVIVIACAGQGMSLPIAFCLGLLPYVVCTSAQTKLYASRLKRNEELVEYVERSKLSQDVLTHDRLFSLAWSRFTSGSKNGVRLLSPVRFSVVDRTMVREFWLATIRFTGTKWMGTNILTTDGILRKRELDAVPFQGFLSRNYGVVFRRIFIFDSRSDLDDAAKGIVKAMVDNNIQVRFYFRSEHDSTSNSVAECEQQLRTADFVIIDEAYLVSYALGKNKAAVSVTCTSDKQAVATIQGIYETMWLHSEEQQETLALLDSQLPRDAGK